MEFIMQCFASVGVFSLYLTIMAIVIRSTLTVCKNLDDDERFALAIIAGIFWPISVPLGLLIAWIWYITAGPFIGIGEEKNIEINVKETNGNTVTEDEEELVEGSETIFNVGDLVTGVKGNPGNYEKLYEGCVCRVLKVGKNTLKIKLVNHIDKDAHEKSIGGVHTGIPKEHMTKIKIVKQKVKSKVKPKTKAKKKK